MRKNAIKHGLFAAVTAVSLAFGTAQAFAAPGPVEAKGSYCLWHECRAECGLGCGGECFNNLCYCDC